MLINLADRLGTANIFLTLNFRHFWNNDSCLKFLILITVQSTINMNEFIVGLVFAKYQSYILTFSPKLTHFHHSSICNNHIRISNSVIFGRNTKAIALLFGQECFIFITFQSAMKINEFKIWSFVIENTKAIALLLDQESFIFITFQSAIKINDSNFLSFLGTVAKR